ncbi:MAG: hypothetical protein WD294_17025 [Phycisphaeraceae bacterium]
MSQKIPLRFDQFSLELYEDSKHVAAFRLGLHSRDVGVDVVTTAILTLGEMIPDVIRADLRESCRILAGQYGPVQGDAEFFASLDLREHADQALREHTGFFAFYELGVVLGEWLAKEPKRDIDTLKCCAAKHTPVAELPIVIALLTASNGNAFRQRLSKAVKEAAPDDRNVHSLLIGLANTVEQQLSELATPGEGGTGAPLTGTAALAADYIREHPGSHGKVIAGHLKISHEHFRSGIVPKLKRHGFYNANGYHPPQM